MDLPTIPAIPGFLAPYVREADFAVRRPWKIGPRRLHDYLLIHVQSGDFAAQIGITDYAFQPGDLCLIQPGVPCVIEGRTDTITPYAHFDLAYDPANTRTFPVADLDPLDQSGPSRIQPSLHDLLGVEIPVRIQPDDPIRFRDLLVRLVGAWQDGDIVSRLEANHIVTELILRIVKTYGGVSATRSSDTPDAFGWITSYLWFHLSDDLSVADMADRAGLSVSRFSTLFRRHVGCSPYRYLRRLRVSHGQELLLETDLILEAIAERCGFANAQHFSTAFRQETGEAPGAFRLRARPHPP
jgi:AraC-like DNA-binding protein